MSWTWDPDKAAANRVKHGLSFETAVLVFDDPLHASKPDPHRFGDAMAWPAGSMADLVRCCRHTWPEQLEAASRSPHHQRQKGDRT